MFSSPCLRATEVCNTICAESAGPRCTLRLHYLCDRLPWRTVVVSFTFGVKVSGDTIRLPGLAAPGLMLLVGGIAGIALNGQLATRRHETEGAFTCPLQWGPFSGSAASCSC